MLSYKLNKSASAEVGLLNAVFVAINFNEVLSMLVAYGNHHSSARDKLLDQRIRNFRRTGRYHNGIERTFALPAFRAVGAPRYNIMVMKFVKKAARLHV